MNKKIIIGSAVVVVIGALVAANVLKNSGGVASFSQGQSFEVKVKKIESGTISSSASASGTIEEVGKSEIYFNTPLKVTKLLVKKKQKVTKGQKLVELDIDDLNSELQQDIISRNVQELAINKVRSTSGGKSTAALELAVTQAENTIKNAEDAYNDSKKKYDDNKKLYEASAISKNELDSSEKALKDSDVALKNAKLSYKTSVANLDEANKNNSQDSSGKDIDIKTQEENLKATILKIASLESKIEKINDSCISPIDGTLTEVNIVEGSYTSSTGSSFTIVDMDKLQVKANVKETDIKNISIGNDVKITGDAIDKGIEVSGKVTEIAPVAVKNKTTSDDETLVEVTISIDKSIPVLKPGLTVTCNIITQIKNNVPLASFEMLTEDKDGSKTVFVVGEKDNIIHKKNVKLGITSDLDAEVLEGLKAGDTVVLNPQPNLKDGGKAKIVKD